MIDYSNAFVFSTSLLAVVLSRYGYRKISNEQQSFAQASPMKNSMSLDMSAN